MALCIGLRDAHGVDGLHRFGTHRRLQCLDVRGR